MSPCRDEFSNGARERGGGVDSEHGDLISTVADALFEFYDGEEVGAG